MEYFWKENKKFVIAVGGGLVFLMLYYSFVLGPIRKGAADAARDRSRAKADLERRMQQGVPTDDGLVSGRRDRDFNRKLLASMIPEVAFGVGERFVLRKGEKIKELYDPLKLDLLKEWGKKAVEGKVRFPENVALPDDVSEETATEVLLRLAVVDRLVTLAVDAEVEKIDTLDGLQGLDPNAAPRKSQFLTKHSAFIRVTGKVESIFKMVHGAQKKGSYLSVTHFDLSRPDATKNLFEASMAVSLLKVDDKGGLETR